MTVEGTSLTSRRIKGSSASGKIYRYGNEYTDGSIRFSTNSETGYTIIEKRINGIWQPASLELGPNTLWVGNNVGVAGIGHHLATEAADGHLHFHAHSEFDGETSTVDTQVVNAYSYTERMVLQPDDTGSWVGQLWESTSMSYANTLSEQIYFKTGSTAATKPIRFQVWQGTDDTGYLIFDQTYTSSDFPADTEIVLDLNGYLEYDYGQNYFNRISSDADFSLKTNQAEDSIWIAVDLSLVREENILQTMGWAPGYDYSEKQYLIYDRKIYVCNTAGVQTGTWESNSDKWDTISSRFVSNYTTGWLEGGQITINSGDNTKLDITAGSVLITDYTDQMNPTINKIIWEN